ncbi:MAG: helix-turn-helix domain-containing protein [Acetobacteraceae bacterium]
MPSSAEAAWATGQTAGALSATPGEALSRTIWLRHVPAATLDRLAQQAVLHRVPSGSILFEQSEIPGFAQLLLAGRVDLLAVNGTNEALIETVHPVDLLLPAAVLNRQPYLARACVVEDAQLVLIHAENFRDAVATDHAMCLAVLACQAAQFRRQVKLAKNLKLRSAEERVGCYLLGLFHGQDLRTPVRLVLEKRRIAWQLGMTRETFSRTLAVMVRYGLHVVGDTVEITDAAAARAHFPFDPLIDGSESVTPLPLKTV